MKEKILDFIVKTKIKYERGAVYVKYVRDFALIAASLSILGLPIEFIAIFVILPLILGHIDMKVGFIQRENRYLAEVVTGFKKKLFKGKER